jgi:hypothetical protein
MIHKWALFGCMVKMQLLDGKLLLSASDLVNFLGCRHATYLDLRDLVDPVEMPERDAATVLIFEKGIAHEKRHLTSLKAHGFAVVEIEVEGFDVAEKLNLPGKRCGPVPR